MPLLFDHLLQALADLEGVAVGGGIEDEDAGHVETSVANVQDVPLDPSVRHGKWKESIQLLPEKQRNRGLSPIISLDHLLQPFADFDGVPVGGGVENENVGHVKANIDG